MKSNLENILFEFCWIYILGIMSSTVNVLINVFTILLAFKSYQRMFFYALKNILT